MRRTPIQIGDINDAESFVKSCIGRARIRVSEHEYEDVVCEGLLALVRLHGLYDPARDGGRKNEPGRHGKSEDRQGVASFAGYAWYLLPNKIRDAWHRLHPEHLLRTVVITDEDTGETKKVRRYQYGTAPVSLDEKNDKWNSEWFEGIAMRNSIADAPGTRHVGDFVHGE
jgi:hypothetical protein